MLPVNEMILYVDVVEFKNFSAAAKRHQMTPAAVSKRMSYLEDQLGVKLLNRSTRNLSLTEAGKALYEGCKHVSRDLYYAYSSTQEVNNEPIGELRVSAPTNFSNLILAPLLGEFCQKYPNVTLQVNLYDVKSLPKSDQFDIAIMAGQLQDSNLFYKKLYTVDFCLCTSPNYFKYHAKPTCPTELLEHNCIAVSYTHLTLPTNREV